MRFNVFHISVIPVDTEALFRLGDMTPTRKNQAIKDSLHKRAIGVYRRRKYRMYDVKGLEGMPDVVYGHIASPDQQTVAKPDDMDEDLIRETVESHRWTHFVYLGEGKQIIAVMDKTDFFSGSVRGVAKLLREMLVKGLDLSQYSGFTFEVEPLTDERHFWDIIDNSTELYGLKFDLVTPNAFGGTEKLTEFLNQQRSKHNATRVVSEIKNRKGELEINSDDEEISAEIEYASRGGGRIQLVYRAENGPIRRWSSDKAKVDIEIKEELKSDDISLREKVHSIIQRLRGLL